MDSTSVIVFFLLIASTTHLIQGGIVEFDQDDFGDGDTISESSSRVNSISSLLEEHLDFETSDGDVSKESTEIIRLRRSQTGKKRSYSRLLTYSCPEAAAQVSKSFSGGAEIYLYRPDSQDENSISEPESKSATWPEADVDLLVNAGFKLNKPTLIYLGGWLHRKNAHWLKEARRNLDEITSNGYEAPFNLVIFDWGAYGFMNYGDSAAMVPYLGELLANFLKQLIDRHKYKANQVHIVSYSLSTHIAGLAGRKLQDKGRGKVAQITAIDPTGVCFHSSKESHFDQDYSLRPTDAKLVVARHYNMNQLGAGRAIGGVDIFVNGGKSQPRMTIQSYNFKDMMGSMGTLWGSHHRGIQHEVSASKTATSSDCHEVAYECPSWRAFKRGQCADCGQLNKSCMLVSTMGTYVLSLKPTEVNYEPDTQMHIITGGRQFCTYNYQIVARLKSKPLASVLAAFESGSVKFKLSGNVNVRPRYRLDEADGNISFTTLLRLDKNRKLPERLDGQSSEFLNSLESLSINFMSNISKEVRTKMSIRYCPDPTGKPELVNCRRTLKRLQ